MLQKPPQMSAKLILALTIIDELYQTVSQVSSLTDLFTQAATLIRERFDLLRVQVYLLNGTNRPLERVAVSGVPRFGTELVLLNSSDMAAQVATTQRPIISPNSVLQSYIGLPLNGSDGQLMGVLELQATTSGYFMVKDELIYQTLATQLVALGQHVRHRLQAEQAVAETESLYQAGVALNTATSYHEILDILHQYTLVGWGNHINLNYFNTPLTATNRPEWIDVLARRTNLPTQGLPTRYPLSAFPSTLAILHPDKPTLVEDVNTSPILDDSLRRWYLDAGFQSIIFVPIVVGGNWLGFFNIAYQRPNKFPAADVRRLMTLVAQSAVAVQNLRNIELLRQRTEQLELLSRIEVALSKTNTEGELLAVLATIFADAATEKGDFTQDLRLTLHYTENDAAGQLNSSEVVAVWQYGQLQPQDAIIGQRFRLDDFPLAYLWLERPNDILLVPEVATDTRLDENIRQILLGLNLKAVVIIPLYSNGRWQGLIFCGWTKPYNFSETEQFVLTRLIEPTAAAVATRRAHLMSEQSRHEIEQRVRHDRLLQNITEKMRQATTLQQLVKITAEELSHHFSAEHILIELGLNPDN